jgi:hypothetical protein
MVRRGRENLHSSERPIQGMSSALGSSDVAVQFLAKRIDVLQTSRHVRIEVNGVEVANTRRAYFLLETGLRRRTYIPVMDVRYDLLTPSDTTSVCPYKVRIFDLIEHDVLGLIPG